MAKRPKAGDSSSDDATRIRPAVSVPSSRPGKKVSPARKWTVRILKGGTVALLLSMILGVAGVGIVYTTTGLPDANSEFKANTTFVTYRDGSPMGNFAIQNRQSIPYAEMPQSVKDAAIAAENRTFWTDRGISVSGMLRAAVTIAGGGEMQGGSTITQQYIKILYLESDRTFARKFKELFLAVKMGRQMPKEEILEGYLNTIYFGRGAYGVQAASKAYFNVDAKDLTVPQAAYLATVLNNPGAFDPSDPENMPRIMDRYRYVLSGMGEMGTISPAQVAEYSAALPEFPEVPMNRRYAGPKGYLMKMVEDELATKGFSQSQISGGGLKIVTTFDPTAQEAAVDTAQKYTKVAASNSRSANPDDLHVAIASIDNATGEVIAIYGGADYVKNNRNWATTPRQTASVFKPFALAAGLRDGFALSDTFQGSTFTPPGDSVPSRNQGYAQYGRVNLIEATAKSINTAFVDLTTRMKGGGEKVAKAAEDAGAPRGAGWNTKTSRIALGIAEVSPLNMAGAYSTFANNGRAIPPHVVQEVFDANGRSIYKADTQGVQAFDQGVARDVTYAMQNVVEEGTGARVAALGRPVAGKTGTAGLDGDIISAWFIAYTPQITTSVMWVAGDEGMGGLDKYKRPGDSTFFGGTYPAMTWVDYMQTAVKGTPVEQFDPPAFVNGGRVARPRPTRTAPPTFTPAPAPSPIETVEPQIEEQPFGDQNGQGEQPTPEPVPGEGPANMPPAEPSTSPATPWAVPARQGG